MGLVVFSENLAQPITFYRLTVENGLSNNKVNTVIQDKTGFIWFGTDDGLNRYDGYHFKVYRHIPSDSNSISNNSIWTLMEDSKGNIWIGTKAGLLDKYNPATEKFMHWKIKSDLTEENSITSIYEDSEGNIWIGSYKDGLYKLNLSTNKFDHWNANSNDDKSLSHNYVQDILEDNYGNIIIGTYNGLNRLNANRPEDGFENFYSDPGNQNALSNNLIWALSKSKIYENIIWVCTANHLTKFDSDDLSFEWLKIDNPYKLQYGTSTNSVVEEIVAGEKIIWTASYSGLVRINLTSGDAYRYVQDDNNLQSICSNQINKIIRDRTGVLWIATENGLSFSTPKSSQFNYANISKNIIDITSILKNKNITALSKSGDDKIWIGTADGLYVLVNIKNNPQLRKLTGFDNFHIWSLALGHENKLWVGTYGKGLKEFNQLTGKITNQDIENSKIKTLSLYYNKSLLRDNKGNMWVGYWGVGAARIDPRTGKSHVWLNEPGNSKSISHNDVWIIKEDSFGRIWLGTQGGGLNLFEDKNGGIFHHWLQKGSNKNSLSGNNINSICEAKKLKGLGNSKIVLWVGTSEGLNKFEVMNNKGNSDLYDIVVENQFYTEQDGLPDNSVNSIIEDDNGNLWLGTGSGISFFNVSKKTFTNFSPADGINGTLMNPESALKLDNNLILFGSTEGLNIFDWKNITLSSYKPEVVITDFQIFNESVRIGKDSPLKKCILVTDKISLSHDQDVFSFEFAALDYNSSESIKYSYMMVGFDKDWIKSGKRRFVTYTNLDPGEYIFRVKSSNADGVWNDRVTTLGIIVNPPWWKSLWAYGLYIVLIILGLLGIRSFELNRTKLRNELKMKEFEVKKKSELDELKSRFFANLSHEFRTPLMLIKGPLEQLKRSKGDSNENIDLIEKNSNRLEELIDQLLELSQLEKAEIPLKARPENIIVILKGILASFEPFAKQKNVSLKFEIDSNSKTCWVDRDKFEKIIYNLLTNAIKFTPADGRVKVAVKQLSNDRKEVTEIKISDSGIGIPENKLDKIFDRFFQVDDSSQRSYGGSGIGLALVKELVDLHKWEISVGSETQKGTEFKLYIPMWDYLNKDEKITTELIDDSLNIKSNNLENGEHFYPITDYKELKVSANTETKPSILIVEDSSDVRKYLSALLTENYIISEAVNGEEGIKVAVEIIPDLIISDIMMPSIDGIEFCKTIKSNWQTSDIPIILLTAKASSESKIEGLEIGADDYLIKPFESTELFTRIKNLLEQRKRLRDKYTSNAFIGTNRISKADSEFLKKTLESIEKNLDKSDFSTEHLAKELFISRAKLHRKINAITGQAPGEFVRTIKLKRASELIMEGKLSLTQIAFEIGFSSPAQFTRAFARQFNCLPSEFSQEIRSKMRS